MTIDIGNECTQCRKDTSFGSGRFVDRIPAGNDEFEGYLCTECRLMTCEMCNEEVIDYGGYNGMIVCDDCNPEEDEDEEEVKEVIHTPNLVWTFWKKG